MQSLSGISEYGSNDFQYPHKRNHQSPEGKEERNHPIKF